MRGENSYTRLTTENEMGSQMDMDYYTELRVKQDKPKVSEFRYLRLFFCFLLGFIMYVCPVPEGLAAKPNGTLGWRLLSIFVFTLATSVTGACPLAIGGILGLALCGVTSTLSKSQAFLGFGNGIIWFIFAALTVGKCVEASHLSNRIACLLISKLGFSTLGLGYAVTLADWMMAPAMPSSAARSGVILPINTQICKMFGSTTHEVGENIGSYLQLVHFAAVQVSSATFLTAMAGSPLLISYARQLGVELDWATWFVCAIVPSIISTIVNPLLLLKLAPPKVKKAEHVQALAIEQLREMGSLLRSRDEMIVLAVLLGMLVMWMLGPGITPVFDATLVAWYGCATLAIFGVLRTEHITENQACWLLVVWFPIVLNMADHLVTYSVFGWFSDNLALAFDGVGWPVVYMSVILAYVLTQYGFTSLTSHLTALFQVMLKLLVEAGAPPKLSALMLCYCSNLGGLTSHYVSVAPLIFPMGYTSTRKWLVVGNVLLLVNLIIWVLIGTGWIYLIGYTT